MARLRSVVSAAWIAAAIIAVPFSGLAAPTVAAVAASGGTVSDIMAAVETGNYVEARRIARASGDSVVPKLVEWLELTKSDEPASFSAYANFLLLEPDWPAQTRLQERAEAALDEEVGNFEVLTFFADRKPLTRQGRLRYARALLEVDRRDAAIEVARTSWIDDDLTTADEAVFLATFGQFLRPEDNRARLDRLLWDGEKAAVNRLLSSVDTGHRALASARLRLQTGSPSAASAMAAVPPALRRDPGLLFDRLRWFRLRGQNSRAQAMLLDATPAAPDHPERWWYERQFQARERMNARDYGVAYRLVAKAGFKEGQPLAESEWLAGWLALRFGKRPDRAMGHFERMAAGVTAPISVARAAYWAGRAASAAKRRDAALTWYAKAAAQPTTYYGQLAADELARPLDLAAVPFAPAKAATEAAFAGRDTVRAARLLCGAGAGDQAVPFLTRIGDDVEPGSVEAGLLVSLAARCGRPDAMVRFGKAAARRGHLYLDASFPVPALLRPGADSVEPALLLALARQESHFDPAVSSSAGAIGLMQLMPGTARAVARTLDVTYSPRLLREDPALNARLGSVYLATQLDRFDGDRALALAAYNAGPSRVAAWLQQYGDPRGAKTYDVIDWIERIPFAETRNYVQRIIEARNVYRLRLDDPDLVPVSFTPTLATQ